MADTAASQDGCPNSCPCQCFQHCWSISYQREEFNAAKAALEGRVGSFSELWQGRCLEGDLQAALGMCRSGRGTPHNVRRLHETKYNFGETDCRFIQRRRKGSSMRLWRSPMRILTALCICASRRRVHLLFSDSVTPLSLIV